MKYEINRDGSNALCVLSGELTFNDHDLFRRMLDEALVGGMTQVTLDLSKLDFIDSAGMGMLLVGQDKSGSEGWSFELKKPQGQVKKMLELAKLSQVINIHS
ncbi:STAS domain-containing protein [Curvivirga sp.]|uniref:STAS domain-containing protein n=1 Tax=Curvivirga sp. TaxID=2856848 RepID=UPI003B5ABC9F